MPRTPDEAASRELSRLLVEEVLHAAELRPLAAESLAAAERAIDALWAPVTV